MKFLNKKAVSVVEYVVLFIIIIGAFLIMRSYIQHGVYGTWAKTGQAFAFGRQYDPQKTIECAYDGQSGNWYDHNCYEFYISTYCPGGACNNGKCPDGNACGCHQDPACQEDIITSTCSAGSSSSCNQLNNGASP